MKVLIGTFFVGILGMVLLFFTRTKSIKRSAIFNLFKKERESDITEQEKKEKVIVKAIINDEQITEKKKKEIEKQVNKANEEIKKILNSTNLDELDKKEDELWDELND